MNCLIARQNSIVGERLRMVRIAHKLTQKAMAEIFFISRSSVACYERGTRQPSYELLLHMADYFQIDIRYLLGSTESGAQQELNTKIVKAARFLSKDGKLDISSLSALHKIMAVEFINYLRITEETDKISNENNA